MENRPLPQSLPRNSTGGIVSGTQRAGGRSVEEIVALRMIEQAQQPQLQHQSVSFPNIVPSKAKGSGISRTSQRGALLSSRADPGFAGSHSTSDLDSRLSLKLGSHAPGSKPRTPGSAASSTGASANLSAAARQQLAREQAVSVSESLAKYCQELQQRIEELESEAFQSTVVIDTLRAEIIRQRNGRAGRLQLTSTAMGGGTGGVAASLGGVGKSGGTGMLSAAGTLTDVSVASGGPDSPVPQANAAGAMSRKQQAAVRNMVRDVDAKFLQLRQLFVTSDPLQERSLAVTTIAAAVRGHIARNRIRQFREALVLWHRGRCAVVVPVLASLCSEGARIDRGIELLQTKQNARWVRTVLSRWSQVVKQTLPMRRVNQLRAEEKRMIKDFKLMKEAFFAFREGCIGRGSTKQTRRERRALMERKRLEIAENNFKATGLRLMATEDELMRAVYHEVVVAALERKRQRLMRQMFAAISLDFRNMRVKARVAAKYAFKKFAGRCFKAWAEWLFLVNTGMDRRRWVAPGKFEPKYNQKQLDNFIHLRIEKMCWRAWRLYYVRSKGVNLRFKKKLTAFIHVYFGAWRVLVKRLRHLLRDAVESWRGYATLMVQTPFYAWRTLATTIKQHREARERLVDAFRRTKMRKLLLTILKTWRHQAVYGSIEGMYSRTTLTKSLVEQKTLSGSLLRIVEQQTLELESCRDLIKKEVLARGSLEKQVAQKDQEVLKLRMKESHAEEEMRRLHAFIEAMSKINPKQVTLIKRLQEEFGFLNRPIASSAGMVAYSAASESDFDRRSAVTIEGALEGGQTGSNAAPAAMQPPPQAPPQSQSPPQPLSQSLGRSPSRPSNSRNARRASISVSASMTAADVAAAARDRFSIDTHSHTTSTGNGTGEGVAPDRRRGADLTSAADTADLLASTTITATGELTGRCLTEEPTVEVPLEVLSISKEDETLLRRCKWLLGRLTMGPPEASNEDEDDADSTKTPIMRGEGALLSHLLAQTGDPSQPISRQNTRQTSTDRLNSPPYQRDDSMVQLSRSQVAARLSQQAVSCPQCFHLHYLPPEECEAWTDAVIGEEEEETLERSAFPVSRPISTSGAPKTAERDIQSSGTGARSLDTRGATKGGQGGVSDKLQLLPQDLSRLPAPLLDVRFLQDTSRMMLAMTTFLADGCVDYFNGADRRHWARTLAEQTQPGSLDLVLAPQEAGWGAGEPEDTDDASVQMHMQSGGRGDTTSPVATTGILGMSAGAANSQQLPRGESTDDALLLQKTSAWTLGDTSGGAQGTWREALRQLQHAYPAGLHAYGLRTEEHGLYQRVSEMRRQLQQISDSVEGRSRELALAKQQQLLRQQSGEKQGGGGDGPPSPTLINIYAASLTKELRNYDERLGIGRPATAGSRADGGDNGDDDINEDGFGHMPQRLLDLTQGGTGTLQMDQFTSLAPKHSMPATSQRTGRSGLRGLGVDGGSMYTEDSGYLVLEAGPSLTSSCAAGSGKFFAQLEGSSTQFDASATVSTTTPASRHPEPLQAAAQPEGASMISGPMLDDSTMSLISDDMSMGSPSVTRGGWG